MKHLFRDIALFIISFIVTFFILAWVNACGVPDMGHSDGMFITDVKPYVDSAYKGATIHTFKVNKVDSVTQFTYYDYFHTIDFPHIGDLANIVSLYDKAYLKGDTAAIREYNDVEGCLLGLYQMYPYIKRLYRVNASVGIEWNGNDTIVNITFPSINTFGDDISPEMSGFLKEGHDYVENNHLHYSDVFPLEKALYTQNGKYKLELLKKAIELYNDNGEFECWTYDYFKKHNDAITLARCLSNPMERITD